MRLINQVFASMNEELPEFKSLDNGIDYLVRYVGRFSEDLWEKEFYTDKRWKEYRDDVNFQETILHVFQENGTYLRIIDGDIYAGSWENTLGGIVIQFAKKHELFERVFLDEQFFILKKHGDHSAKGNSAKYFMVITESLSHKMSRVLRRPAEWNDILDQMYEKYRKSSNFMVVIFFVVCLVIILYSIF